MKLVQVSVGGTMTAAVLEQGSCRALPGWTVSRLLAEVDARGGTVAELAASLQASGTIEMDASARRLIPLVPAEVWGCGCTYAPSADFRDGELGTRDGMYSYVHNPANRPETFFKGTARVCVGPDEGIGIRRDSSFTAPEPEVGIVTGASLRLLGYVLGNDVSAWDIERENPLYLPQSKVYRACCSLGPVLVTPDEIPDPYALEMTCTIERDGREIFRGSASTAQLRRKYEDLIEVVGRCNPLPTPTVILTGTGIIVKEDAALRPGDLCRIRVPGLGELSNHAEPV